MAPSRSSLPGLVAVLSLLVALKAAASTPGGAEDREAVRQGERLAREMCVACHEATPPDALPRGRWRSEIESMQRLRSGLPTPLPGERTEAVTLDRAHAKILAWYEARATLALPSPAPWPAVAERPLRFVRRSHPFPDAATPQPAVANIRLADLEGDARPEMLVSDMRHGLVLVGRPGDAGTPLRVLAPIPNPVHTLAADLDRDGFRDVVVGDLGAFYPGDHLKGSVTLLKGLPGGRFAQFVQSGFPRVADVQTADFDGDGRGDILVAAFGWRKVGEIALLLYRSLDLQRPQFERRRIDARPGAVRAQPADLDGDGDMDFVALIAQEHEKVVAFFNQGSGTFVPETLYAAPHPNWGYSGLDLADVDGDGDLDALVANGDMFDDRLLKPYHGLEWLENTGRFPWVSHPLARLAGVHGAQATDLDRDGDIDGDGDFDLVVGNFVTDKYTPDFVDVWENFGPDPVAGPSSGRGTP